MVVLSKCICTYPMIQRRKYRPKLRRIEQSSTRECEYRSQTWQRSNHVDKFLTVRSDILAGQIDVPTARHNILVKGGIIHPAAQHSTAPNQICRDVWTNQQQGTGNDCTGSE